MGNLYRKSRPTPDGFFLTKNVFCASIYCCSYKINRPKGQRRVQMTSTNKQVVPTASARIEKVAKDFGCSPAHVANIRSVYEISLDNIEDVFRISKRQSGKPEKVAELIQRGIRVCDVETVYEIRDALVNSKTVKQDTVSLSTIAKYILRFNKDLDEPDDVVSDLMRIMELRDRIGESYLGSAVREVIEISRTSGIEEVEAVFEFIESNFNPEEE